MTLVSAERGSGLRALLAAHTHSADTSTILNRTRNRGRLRIVVTVGESDRHLADSSRSDLTSHGHATEVHAPLRLTGRLVEGSLSDTPLGDLAPVSYTHLTLPTIYSV